MCDLIHFGTKQRVRTDVLIVGANSDIFGQKGVAFFVFKLVGELKWSLESVLSRCEPSNALKSSSKF